MVSTPETPRTTAVAKEPEGDWNDPRDLLKRVLAYAPSPPSRGLLADIEACLEVPDSDLRAVQLPIDDWQRLLGIARFTYAPQDERILNAIQAAIANKGEANG